MRPASYMEVLGALYFVTRQGPQGWTSRAFDTQEGFAYGWQANYLSLLVIKVAEGPNGPSLSVCNQRERDGNTANTKACNTNFGV